MNDWSTALRDAGLRVTAGRLAVLAALEERQHLGVAEVATAVRERVGSASTQAVYDILGALHDAGIIRRVEPAGQPPRFELQTGDNHHHLMCRRCGAMFDVACHIGHAPACPYRCVGLRRRRGRGHLLGHLCELQREERN
ncbi:Fur family transcriptional regulator [Tessaracoccus coleopterorum]|uniref:Fur family transcriptional regulator n=1 Tax=Tessaracoccus coleopterorum TaxID=2714950 RepID=UPI002F912ABD